MDTEATVSDVKLGIEIDAVIVASGMVDDLLETAD